MADLPRYPDNTDDTGVRPNHESTTGIPRWVFLVGVALIIVALLVVVTMVIGSGGGGHIRPLH